MTENIPLSTDPVAQALESLQASAMANIERLGEKIRELRAENKRLRDVIDCACNALTDSVKCSGNDAETNMHWVRKLRRDGLGESK